MSDEEYVYSVKDVIEPGLSAEARAELCMVAWQQGDLDSVEIQPTLTAAIKAHAAAAEAALTAAQTRERALAGLLADAQLFLDLTARGVGINLDGGRTISGTVLLAKIAAALAQPAPAAQEPRP